MEEFLKQVIEERKAMFDMLLKIEKRLQQLELAVVNGFLSNPSKKDVSSEPEKKGLVNESEAAKIIGMSVHWLRRKRWSGGGPEFIKVGASAVRYEVATLRAHMSQGKMRSTSDFATKKA